MNDEVYEIDEATGLVKVPKGMYWRVIKQNDDYYYQRPYRMTLRRKWRFGYLASMSFRWLDEKSVREASVSAWSNYQDILYTVSRNAEKRAAQSKDKQLAKASEKIYVGNYPPKRVGKQ